MLDARTRSRYTAMRWNTPLSESRAEDLFTQAGVAAAASLLDLGCGWGELLLRALARGSSTSRATGVDTEPHGLEWARAQAEQRGLAARVSFLEADATTWREPAEVVLCLGAAHAWSPPTRPLQALHAIVSPGGRLLYGDGFWAAEPNEAAIAIFGEQLGTRAQLVASAEQDGWRVEAVSDASLEEWDEFEAGFRAGDERWANAHPDDPQAATTLAEMADRREEYETVYRGVLGFAYLVLAAP